MREILSTDLDVDARALDHATPTRRFRVPARAADFPELSAAELNFRRNVELHGYATARALEDARPIAPLVPEFAQEVRRALLLAFSAR